ncbi:hypothetical protein SKP52_16980 [Sphingopyxis fribergensis]|jgi:hypothetical protein|uniref:Uncharacterized protein n=1 Tax=Sphingopyxis fribergensis TaxID=1515612 RepID=A0A0A7PM38_9SPHN|nr:hypothetical protein SKP52_16980 [Sphingopyxis fribergensis]
MFKRAKPTGKGAVPDHLRDRFRYLDGLAPASALGPWRKLTAVAVGGLQHIGFASKSDLLLVVSVSGRGVVDCATGGKVARDDEEYHPDFGSLEAEGIGPLEGQQIRVAGTSGGGLSHATEDGWLIELHPLSWPEEEFFLCPPGQTMLWNPPAAEPELFKLRPLPSSLVAYGFSPTGKSFVIATSSDLEIYSRA